MEKKDVITKTIYITKQVDRAIGRFGKDKTSDVGGKWNFNIIVNQAIREYIPDKYFKRKANE